MSDKEVYRYDVKIVPRAEPNSDGRWVEVETTHKMHSFFQAHQEMRSLLPPDHFMVQYHRRIGL